MDAVVSVLAALGVAVMISAAAGIHRSRERSRLLGRLKVQTVEAFRRAPGGPLLDGWAARVAETRRGGRFRDWATIHHPGVPFSDVIATALAGMFAGLLAGGLVFGGLLGPLLGAVTGPYLAHRVFMKVHGNRAARIEKQLPEALSLQASVLRAGQSLDRSLRVLAGETRSPLREELERMLGEIDLGRPVDQAIEQFGARIPSRDVDMWMTAMLVHRQTGGNLAAVVDASAVRVTQRLQLRGEVRAMTAQGRLSGLVVAVAPLAFFLLLSAGSRSQMEFLFSTPIGLMTLLAGLVMNGLGMLWIRNALRIR